MFICRLHIFSGEVSLQMFWHFLNQLVLLLSFESCLYITDISPLSDVCFLRKVKLQAGLNDKSAHTISCKIQRYNVQTSGSVKSSFSLFSFISTLHPAVLAYLRHSFSDGDKIAAVIPDLTSLNHTVQKEGGLA